MKESFLKNRKGIILMLFSSLFACLGQLLWKLAISEGTIMLLAGFCLYGLGALLMLVAYRYGKLSILQPVLSMNYILSAILGLLVFQEIITPVKSIGILLIMAGVFFISGGDKVD